MLMNDKIIDILWTGGFDSTFRMCQLSKKDITIRPYYILSNRKSTDNEVRAIRTVYNKLVNSSNTVAKILPVEYIAFKTIIRNEKIITSHRRFAINDYLGSQYAWLSCFSIEHQGIELSIEKDTLPIRLIEKYGRLLKTANLTGEVYVVDKNKSSDEIVDIFGSYTFPLVDYSKLDMLNMYKEMGFDQIINDTWFCHNPINNQPCGYCNPCIDTIEAGLKHRFSDEAINRYRKHKG